jgi:hypothetical protein
MYRISIIALSKVTMARWRCGGMFGASTFNIGSCNKYINTVMTTGLPITPLSLCVASRCRCTTRLPNRDVTEYGDVLLWLRCSTFGMLPPIRL